MPLHHQASLLDLFVAIHGHLEHELIPFWNTHAIDEQYGGYHTAFDDKGTALPQPEKYLNVQARMLWWFSRLARAYPDRPDYRAKAQQGATFIIGAFWDPGPGGWRWKVAQDGAPIDDGKVVYGQSFAIYAFAEFARATGDPQGLHYAETSFELLQTYAADTQHGGYFENFEPDWSLAAPGFHGGDRKSLDTHMHLMEAFTALWSASGAETHRRRLLELIALIAEQMIDPGTGCGLNQFDHAWRTLPAIAIRRTWNAERMGEAPHQPVETTSYGHNTELAWLMHLALQSANVATTPYLSVLRGLLDHALAHGVDWECGGLFRDGLRAGGPLVREKEFWQHAEALVGFLDGYELFGDERYLDAARCIWSFVDRWMIAHEVGEWRVLLDRAGKPLDRSIGNNWKGAYHTGRAMLECSERLQRLLARRRVEIAD